MGDGELEVAVQGEFQSREETRSVRCSRTRAGRGENDWWRREMKIKSLGRVVTFIEVILFEPNF